MSDSDVSFGFIIVYHLYLQFIDMWKRIIYQYIFDIIIRYIGISAQV